MRSKQFAKDYGVLLTDGPLAGVTARALLVIDGQQNVIYSQLVQDIRQEPDYQALEQLLKDHS